jgi:4-amino-4-deoxy-L-arabinose transferase-like glycosyltransferase
MNRLKLPALVRRFPAVPFTPASLPVLPADVPGTAASLEGDAQAVREMLEPAFELADTAALRAQNRFRLVQVVVIGLGALAAIFGAVQSGVGDDAHWPGVVQAVAAGIAGAVALWRASYRAQRVYLDQRLCAERLRGEAFLLLGRVGYPADDAAAHEHLRRRVAQIVSESTGSNG